MMAKARAAGPRGIDGTIGIFMDEDGKPLLLDCVRSAITDVAATLPARSYAYPPLLGTLDYRTVVTELIFPKQSRVVASLATTGGTGALAINLRLAKLMHEDIQVLLPTPAYVNHTPLCTWAGLHVNQVPYLVSGVPSIDGIVEGLRNAKQPMLVVLQAGCNNPLGLDLSWTQWQKLVPILAERQCLVLLDFPYQGFASTPEEDAKPAELLADHGVPTLIAWSGAKNHSIYSERAGLACTVVPDAETKSLVEAHYSMITRGLHSPAATFGQLIVARVHAAYKEEWLSELQSTRELLEKKRKALMATLPPDFQKALDGKGMFALLPLSELQTQTLQDKHHVFLTSGRINIAGIPLKRIGELAEKICAVVS